MDIYIRQPVKIMWKQNIYRHVWNEFAQYASYMIFPLILRRQNGGNVMGIRTKTPRMNVANHTRHG